jgi:hypothetical protein
MDPRDPSQRPSIFDVPDPTEEHRATQSPPSQQSARQYRPRPPVGPDSPMPPGRQGHEGPSRGLVIGLGVCGVLLLLIGGLVARVVLGPDGAAGVAATSPSATAAATVRPSVSATPVASATPRPTPVPTPAGPPQEIALEAWATVSVDVLNVRTEAGPEATSNYSLVRGAVVRVSEGPVAAAGQNWYRVASLGGAAGWASSGWEAEPYLSTLVEDPTLIRCGEVERAVFDVVDGVATPHDPLVIGGLALPAAVFSDLSLGTIELIRGVGGEACFSAQVGSNGMPQVTSQLSVTACGHAEPDGDLFRLRPAAGQPQPVESQVKDPAIVHPSTLVGGPPDNRRSSNLRGVITMMASRPEATGCIYLSVTEDASGVEAYKTFDTTQCSIVHEYNADNLRLSPAAGGDEVWIKLTSRGSQPGIFALEVPVAVAVSASASDESRDAYTYLAYEAACG